MSNREVMPVPFGPHRGVANAMTFATLLVLTALAMQWLNGSAPVQNGVVRRPILLRMMDAPAPEPSAYDVEHSMGPKALIGRWDSMMDEASARFDVPKAWIKAVMHMESGGRTMLSQDKPMVSRAGALGLMQVLPDTYNEMRRIYKLGDNPFDAHDNILAGTAYLKWLHKRYGFPAMFAAYNAGPGRLEDHLVHHDALPAETRAYVGGIARQLSVNLARSNLLKVKGETVKLTRPDGVKVAIDASRVTAIRAAAPGEFAPSVQAVISMGRRKQGVRENVMMAKTAIRTVGGLI